MFKYLFFILVVFLYSCTSRNNSTPNWIKLANDNYVDSNNFSYKILPGKMGIILYTLDKQVWKIESSNPAYSSKYLYKICKDYKNKQTLYLSNVDKINKTITKVYNLNSLCKYSSATTIMNITSLLKDNKLYVFDQSDKGSDLKIYSNNGELSLEVFSESVSVPVMLSDGLAITDLAQAYADRDSNQNVIDSYNTDVNFINLYVIPKINKNNNLNLADLKEIN